MDRAPHDPRDARLHDRHRRQVRLRQDEHAAVQRQQELDRRHQQPLPRGRRRHLAADARAVVVHHGAVRHLLVEPLPRAAQPQGVPRPDADPRDRHERHVRRPGPDPVLRLLRDRPAPDVLHDRRVGRPEPRVRVDQVLPVHAVRLGADAAVLPGALLQGRRPGVGHTFDMVLLSHAAGAGLVQEHRAPHLRRPVPRLRDQGADVPVPHLAARRAHRGAHRRLGAPGRDPAEARHLRLHPHRAPDPAGGGEELGALDRAARR